jgi:hypothetical protein
MVHATSAAVASNSVWNVCKATDTTVMSRIDMIAPSTTTPATISTPRSSPESDAGLPLGSSGTSAARSEVSVLTRKG